MTPTHKTIPRILNIKKRVHYVKVYDGNSMSRLTACGKNSLTTTKTVMKVYVDCPHCLKALKGKK